MPKSKKRSRWAEFIWNSRHIWPCHPEEVAQCNEVMDVIESWMNSMEDVSGWRMQLEYGGETNRVHIQGGVQFKEKKKKRFETLAKQFKRYYRIHGVDWAFSLDEPPWANADLQNNAPQLSFCDMRTDVDFLWEDYLQKDHEDGTFPVDRRFGGLKFTPKQQGRRNDIHRGHRFIREKKGGLLDLLRDEDMFQCATSYKSGFSMLEADVAAEDLEMITPKKCVWVYGPTGIGKSYGAVQITKALTAHLEIRHWMNTVHKYEYGEGGVAWQDLYNRQPLIWMEEFAPGSMKLQTLNQLADEGLFSMKRRGVASIFSAHKMVLVTSNYHPSECYRKMADPIVQSLVRRFHIVNPQTREEMVETTKKITMYFQGSPWEL